MTQSFPPVVAPAGSSLVLRLLRVLKREPILFVTLAYLLISFIGIWASYWFYKRFGIPILQFMQGSDYLVAGLREPAYLGLLLAALVISWMVTWPERWRRRNADRSEAMRQRWWGKIVFPGSNPLWSWWGMTPETGVVFSTFWVMIWMVFALMVNKAEDIRRGAGQPLRLTLAGSVEPLPGNARLLGTSSAFVFVYWPEDRRAEALPIESITRIHSLRPADARTSATPPRPAKPHVTQ